MTSQWFNQAEQWHPSALDASMRSMLKDLVGRTQLPHDCAHGDGEPLEDVLAEIRRVLVSSKLLFDWELHDLLMIDTS